jgi:predicted nucleotidyltransferase
MTTATARIEAALATAQAVMTERYPDADFAFVAGSVIRGQGTAHSDIDLVVVYRRIGQAGILPVGRLSGRSLRP